MSELLNIPIHSTNLKGYQQISAIWFPFVRFSQQQCKQLIIDNWFRDCQLYLFEQGYLLRFPTPLAKYCHQIVGWPLIEQAGKLCSTRFTDHEQQSLPHADLILLQGYHVVAMDYSAGQKIDPARWLKVDDYVILTMDDWTPPLMATEYIDPNAEVKDLESILGKGIPKPSDALLKFIQKTQSQSQSQSSSHQQQVASGSENRSANFLANTSVKWVILILIIIFASRRFLTGLSVVDKNNLVLGLLLLIGLGLLLVATRHLYHTYVVANVSANVAANNNNHQHAKSKNSDGGNAEQRKNHKPQRWRNYLARLAIVTKLHHWIAFRQGNYINAMMKKFENGDLEDALKYAVPLNNSTDQLSQQAFGSFKPRNKLSLSEKYYGSSSTVFLDYQTQERIRELYKRSFDKLAKENRVEEATFVLIELLDNINEGVEYLEKNGRLQQALDIAIARDADANIIVRLCCLTEQWDKAIMIARRNHAFANTVMLLEKEQPQFADRLRLIWATTLAEQAEWLAAIDAVWPLKKYRHLADEWFEYAELAEEFNADALIKRLILQPESIHQYQSYIEQLQNEPELYNQRLAIASAILKHKSHVEQLKGILRPLINVIIVDIIEQPSSINKSDLVKLVDLCQDNVLKMDLPLDRLTIKSQKSLSQDNRKQLVNCATLGNRVIYDAVPLRNGHYLLALGEAGAIVVDKHGQQLHHYMVAAHHFVLSHNRRQVLVLAKRDDCYHIHKLDVAQQHLISLGHINFQYCMWTFDGIHWSIVANDHIRVVDTQQSLAIVWQVALTPYTPIEMASSPEQEFWLLKDQSDKLEEWDYSLPERRLRSRSEIKISHDQRLISWQYSNVSYLRYSKLEQKAYIKFNWQAFKVLPIAVNRVQFDNMSFYVMREFVIFVVPKEEDGVEIYIYHPNSHTVKMVLEWPFLTSLKARASENDVVFFDNRGRCCHVDVEKNGVIDFRI